MSVRKTVTSTRCSHLVPASSRMARTLANTLWHWATMSLARTFPSSSKVTPGMLLLPRTRGPIPERKRRFPTRRAWGNWPTGAATRAEVTDVTEDLLGDLQLDADVLRLSEKAQRLDATLSAHARLLHAAEWSAQVSKHPAIHPHNSRLKPSRDTVGARQVGGPNRRREAVGGGIGQRQCLLVGLEGLQRGHRPENLVLVGSSLGTQALKQGGLHEVPVLAPAGDQDTFASTQQAPSLGPGDVQTAQHFL